MSNLTCRVVDIVEDFIQVQKYVIHIFTTSVHTYTRHCDGSFVQWFCSHTHDPWTDQLIILISMVDESYLARKREKFHSGNLQSATIYFEVDARKFKEKVNESLERLK